MALPPEKSYTIDDIYALPDGTWAELIDGEMYRMAPPGTGYFREIPVGIYGGDLEIQIE